MRRLRYSVAASLDGFIADEDGGFDWIPDDDAIDFGAYLSKVDTLVMGRGTYEVSLSTQGTAGLPGLKSYVVSTTLDPADHPDVTVVSEDPEGFVAELKERPGKDIWLFGGGVLFRSLHAAGLVDRIEVAVVPVVLGTGIALHPGPAPRVPIELHSCESFPSGIVLLKYDVRSP